MSCYVNFVGLQNSFGCSNLRWDQINGHMGLLSYISLKLSFSSIVINWTIRLRPWATVFLIIRVYSSYSWHRFYITHSGIFTYPDDAVDRLKLGIKGINVAQGLSSIVDYLTTQHATEEQLQTFINNYILFFCSENSTSLQIWRLNNTGWYILFFISGVLFFLLEINFVYPPLEDVSIVITDRRLCSCQLHCKQSA